MLSEKKYGSTVLISEKMEAFYAELNERAEAATSSYSVTGDFLECAYFLACDYESPGQPIKVLSSWSQIS